MSAVHDFHKHHFNSPRWCDSCGEFIWGVGKQGYKCSICRYSCHGKCRQTAEACGPKRDKNAAKGKGGLSVGQISLDLLNPNQPRPTIAVCNPSSSTSLQEIKNRSTTMPANNGSGNWSSALKPASMPAMSSIISTEEPSLEPLATLALPPVAVTASVSPRINTMISASPSPRTNTTFSSSPSMTRTNTNASSSPFTTRTNTLIAASASPRNVANWRTQSGNLSPKALMLEGTILLCVALPEENRSKTMKFELSASHDEVIQQITSAMKFNIDPTYELYIPEQDIWWEDPTMPLGHWGLHPKSMLEYKSILTKTSSLSGFNSWYETSDFGEGLLSIEVIRGEGLATIDGVQIVKITLLDEYHKTISGTSQKTFKAPTSNPNWKVAAENSKATNVLYFLNNISTMGRVSNMVLSVWGNGKSGKSIFMGQVIINWHDFKKYAAFEEGAALTLSKRASPKETDRVCGMLLVKFGFTPAVPRIAYNLIPPMNIIILIVGSRGDVQPFIAFGQKLKSYGHQVRIASHAKFCSFVREQGLDFYPLRGDPETLMKYMSEHPDMISLSPFELKQQTNTLKEIFDSVWLACTTPTRKSGHNVYIPDIIISNPPVAVHVHVAEKLQVPLQIMFTMPWTPTHMYRHPFACFGPATIFSNKDSYGAIDKMIWTGQGPLINDFRKRVLKLSPVSNGATLVAESRVPHTYCMSPNLVLKPDDWGPHIDVCGFWFLDLVSSFDPDKVCPELVEFLNQGDKPFYIGFGSIVVEDPQALSKKVIGALSLARKPDGTPIRAIVHQGWAKLGEGCAVGPNIHLLAKAVPHDWLLPLCSAVCHHGGAGTLSAGLRCGLPTVVVSFFGDQPFWGNIVAKRGVGPPPIFNADLTEKNLTKAIEFCYQPDTITAAQKLGVLINSENGVETAAKSFFRKLPVNKDGKFECEYFENQKKGMGGWKAQEHTDKSMVVTRTREGFLLPPGWKWDGEWTPETTPNTDSEGWSYRKTASGWKHWAPNPSEAIYRRRRWYRSRSPIPYTVIPPIFTMNPHTPITIFVDVIKAENLKNMDLVPKYPGDCTDPYAVICVQKNKTKTQKQITKILVDNLNPAWNQTFYFQVTEGDEFYLKVLDWGVTSDDLIGRARIPIDPTHFGLPLKYELSNGGGSVYLKMDWFDPPAGITVEPRGGH